MTEKEAIEELKCYRAQSGTSYPEEIEVAIVALEEIQQYRAVGTPDEMNQLKENGAFTGVELAELAIMQMKLKEYLAIGTPEECRAAVGQLKAAKEDIRKLLCHEYACLPCEFCRHDENEEAMCVRDDDSGSWCCENAAWKEHGLE